MTSIFWIILAITCCWSLFYLRAGLITWAAFSAGILGIWTYIDNSSRFAQLLSWVICVSLFLPLLVYPLRQKLISRHIYRIFKKVLPVMSTTEKEALEAGSVWWDGDLFSGKPNWNKLLSTPLPKLSADEKIFLSGPVEELCAMLDDWKITHECNDLPANIWQFIKENKFFGMIIPKEFGGLEFSAIAHSAVVMKIASRSVAAAVTVMVPNSLGPAELLLHYGTSKQKNHFLPGLANGIEVPCFALTGPDAGSDASAMPDMGIVCRQDFEGVKDVLGIRLNWEKRYITLGPVATLLGLAFKLNDPDHLLGEKEELGITVALIPTDTPGITIGRRHFPLNIPFQNGPNSGKDVFIPLDWIIGGKKQIGKGWRMLMESLAAGRSISLPSLSTGAGKLACRATGAYARIRKQFNMPIGRFEGVEESLTRMAAYTYRMDAVRTLTAGAVDMGEKPSVLSAIAKYNLTETMRTVVNDAMDVQGGAAICMGPRNFMARVYQSIPISITVEGANILTRTLIIFGQGAIRCHPYVLKEMLSVTDKDQKRGLATFDRALFGHIGFTLSNVARSFLLGLTNSRLVKAPVKNGLQKYYRYLTRMSSVFALLSDMSMLTMGGALKRKEKLSGRLADVLSQLYISSACLKRFEDQGCPEKDRHMVRWVCEDSLYKMQQSIFGLLRNYPVKPIAWFLRFIAFPFGRTFRRPSDELGHLVAGVLLEPSSARDRLTNGIYVPQDTSQALGRIEYALVKVIAAEPIEKIMQGAIKIGVLEHRPLIELLDHAVEKMIISPEQAEIVRDAQLARRDVITVDDFPQDLQSSKDVQPGKEHLLVNAVH